MFGSVVALFSRRLALVADVVMLMGALWPLQKKCQFLRVLKTISGAYNNVPSARPGTRSQS